MNIKKLAVYSMIAFMFIIPFVAAAPQWTDVFGNNWFGQILKYIFGPMTDITQNDVSNAIITIAVWLLIMVTFGDIISTFSTFTPKVSWFAAFLIGVVAANLNWATNTIAWFTGLFATLGAIAVIVGLGGAFVAFVIVNLGLWQYKRWILQRRAMMEAATSQAGGKKLAGTITGLGEVGKAMRKI